MSFGKLKPYLVTLVLGSTLLCCRVSAVGLGDITTSSLLGQPLRAEIVVVDASQEYQAEEMVVRKVEAGRIEELGFEVLSNNYGLVLSLENTRSGVVVRVITRRPLLEPFINFHLQLLWPRGSLIREYTLFLDPPAVTAAVSSAGSASAGSSARPASDSDPSAARLGSPRTAGRPVAAVDGATYQVKSGDSLSSIANRWAQGRPQSRAAVVQWLHRNNPDAFIRGDINRLKAGARLKLPEQHDRPLQLIASANQQREAEPARQLPAGTTETPKVPGSESAGKEESRGDAAGRAWMDNLPGHRQGSEIPSDVKAPADRQSADTAEGKLRLSRKDGYQAITTPSFAELDAESPEAIKAYIDTARETIDRVQRDNADLRRQVDDIENSEYLNSLKELVDLQAQQLQQLKQQRSASGSAGAGAGSNAVSTAAVTTSSRPSTQVVAAAQAGSQSMIEVDAATPLAQSPLENRQTYKWIAALGMLLLALVLLGLIIRRLWQQQQPRFKTMPLPVNVAPIVVAAGGDQSRSAIAGAAASTSAGSKSTSANSNSDAALSASSEAGGSLSKKKSRQAANEEPEFEITDEDLKELGALELDIDDLPMASVITAPGIDAAETQEFEAPEPGGTEFEAPVLKSASQSASRSALKSVPQSKGTDQKAAPVAGSQFEDVLPTSSQSTIDDDWDELFDAIISKETAGGGESDSFELRLDSDSLGQELELDEEDQASVDKWAKKRD